MSLVLDTGTMKYRQNPNQPWRPLVIKAGMNWESMADTYDPDNGTYEVGQYVLEEGMMYRCISEITTPEAWTPAHWTSVNVGDELSSFIIISDDQPTDETNKIWIAETTAPFGVQIPTMDDHNALGNTLTQLKSDTFGNINLTGTNNTGAPILSGTFFYNNGVLVRAKQNILDNAPITSSNTETVTAGGLNSIESVFAPYHLTRNAGGSYSGDHFLVSTCYKGYRITDTSSGRNITMDLNLSDFYDTTKYSFSFAETQFTTSGYDISQPSANNYNDYVWADNLKMKVNLDKTQLSVSFTGHGESTAVQIGVLIRLYAIRL